MQKVIIPYDNFRASILSSLYINAIYLIKSIHPFILHHNPARKVKKKEKKKEAKRPKRSLDGIPTLPTLQPPPPKVYPSAGFFDEFFFALKHKNSALDPLLKSPKIFFIFPNPFCSPSLASASLPRSSSTYTPCCNSAARGVLYWLRVWFTNSTSSVACSRSPSVNLRRHFMASRSSFEIASRRKERTGCVSEGAVVVIWEWTRTRERRQL